MRFQKRFDVDVFGLSNKALNVNFLAFWQLFPIIGQYFIQFLGHTGYHKCSAQFIQVNSNYPDLHWGANKDLEILER
jgi:hypothetical protein